jgi:hypothetical protein
MVTKRGKAIPAGQVKYRLPVRKGKIPFWLHQFDHDLLCRRARAILISDSDSP